MARTYRIYLEAEGSKYRIVKAAKKPFGDLIGLVDMFESIKAKVVYRVAFSDTIQFYRYI